MEGKFEKSALLSSALVTAIASLLGIVVLFLFDFPSSVEIVLYYLFFSVLLVSAILYNVVSFQKGQWLWRKFKNPFQS